MVKVVWCVCVCVRPPVRQPPTPRRQAAPAGALRSCQAQFASRCAAFASSCRAWYGAARVAGTPRYEESPTVTTPPPEDHPPLPLALGSGWLAVIPGLKSNCSSKCVCVGWGWGNQMSRTGGTNVQRTMCGNGAGGVGVWAGRANVGGVVWGGVQCRCVCVCVV